MVPEAYKDYIAAKLMTDEELEKMQARCDAATPGPWKEYDPCEFPGDIRISRAVKPEPGERNEGYIMRLTHSQHRPSPKKKKGPGYADPRREDAKFIVYARRDLPRLVAEVRRLRAFYESAKDRFQI